MRSCLLALALVAALAGSSSADRLMLLADIPKVKPMSERLQDTANWLSDEVGLHLENLSFELLDLGWNVRQKTAYLRLDTGDHAGMGLRVDSRFRFRSSYAEVKTRLDLSVMGERLTLDLPEFDMFTESVNGQRIVGLRVPLIKGRF